MGTCRQRAPEQCQSRGAAVTPSAATSGQMPTHVTSPRLATGNTACNCGMSPRRSDTRFDGARNTITAIENRDRSCWKGRLRSTVTKASYSCSARARRSPFLRPAPPASGTVLTSCARMSPARRRSTHSSRSTSRGRGGHSCGGLLKECHHLLALDGRESRQEVVDRLAAFETINQRLNRHASAREDSCTAQDVW